MRFWKLFCILLLLFPVLAIAKKQRYHEENAPPQNQAVTLQILQQKMNIDGQPAIAYKIVQPNGTMGLTVQKGQTLDITVENRTSQATVLHWHGISTKNDADGAPFVTQTPIAPGAKKKYTITFTEPGTYFMHSHYKLQQQALMAAPLLVLDPAENNPPDKEVTMFLQDYEINPQKSYPILRRDLLQQQANIQTAADNTGGPEENTAPSEITMDAYLTNRHTLAAPELIRVTPGMRVKIRVINASANTNFFLDLGSLTGALLTVDGRPVERIEDTKFAIAQGQRLDIGVLIPDGDNYYPILAQAEGTSKLTGLILATPNAIIDKMSDQAAKPAGAFTYAQETKLRGDFTYRRPDESFTLNLQGNLLSYIWTINNEVWPKVTPLQIKQGERVQITFNNKTAMSIPFHLHGHPFHVVQINENQINGAVRDTILVLPYSSVTVQFDADNPGIWLLQGMIPFQTYAGIGTLINYEGVTPMIFKQKDTGIPPSL